MLAQVQQLIREAQDLEAKLLAGTPVSQPEISIVEQKLKALTPVALESKLETAPESKDKLQWQSMALGVDQLDSKAYSMFPIQDQESWGFYCTQEVQFWSAKELKFAVDHAQFPKLSPRYQELYGDMLGFFAPGDGLVSKGLLRFILECTTYSEMQMFIAQLFIELVHSEAYGMSITSIIPDPEAQAKVFAMVDSLPCVKAKAQFMKQVIESGASKSERLIGAACYEGIFFVTIFAMIFYLKRKNIMVTFSFLNEQVSKDETLHRDYACLLAVRNGLPSRKRILEIIERAVQIEIDHVKYLLRSPIDSIEVDTEAGMTVENLSKYARSLGDHILVQMGCSTHYNESVKLPWMDAISLSRKPNFYETQVGSYKKISLKDAINWKQRAGLEKSGPDAVASPGDVDF